MKRQVPKMATDEEAEAFLESDLSDLDFSQFKPARFQFTKRLTQQGKSIPNIRGIAPAYQLSRPWDAGTTFGDLSAERPAR